MKRRRRYATRSPKSASFKFDGLSFSFIRRWKFHRSSVTYYMYAPSLGSFPPRLKKKYFALSFLRSNLQIWVAETRTLKTSNLNHICDALRQQSSVATLNFSFTALATVALLETASLVTRRQQVAPTKKSVVGGWIKGGGELFCFGVTSPCACTLFESCEAERNSSPHPLYIK